MTLVFEKDANFVAENRRKSSKIAENCEHRPQALEADAALRFLFFFPAEQ
jgi:hypothetical protein